METLIAIALLGMAWLFFQVDKADGPSRWEWEIEKAWQGGYVTGRGEGAKAQAMYRRWVEGTNRMLGAYNCFISPEKIAPPYHDYLHLPIHHGGVEMFRPGSVGAEMVDITTATLVALKLNIEAGKFPEEIMVRTTVKFDQETWGQVHGFSTALLATDMRAFVIPGVAQELGETVAQAFHDKAVEIFDERG